MKRSLPPLDGVEKRRVDTGRLTMNVLERSGGSGPVVLFIHGNVSSATFWEETMLALPDTFRAVACDLRGYGETDPQPIDATKGLADMAADVHSLVETLRLGRVHIVGHSMGGGVVMKYAIAHPEELLSLTLVDPVSPFGYSGTKDADGTPCTEDGAPAGGAGINPDFVRLLREGYTGTEEQMAPRNVFRRFYVKPPIVPRREDALVESMLATRVGDDWYPGDSVPSNNWPGAAPVTKGVLNALSGKYFDASPIARIEPKPPLHWIRGADDLIVSNNAMFDMAALGAMGAVPGWPGTDVCPPQPMLDQTERVLSTYEERGGTVARNVIADAGHSPYLDQAQDFNARFIEFLNSV